MTTPQPLRRNRLIGLSAVLAAAALAAGCASKGPNSALETARADVKAAGQDANVVRLSPIELKAAQDAVARADRHLSDKGDGAEVNHLAYVAAQRAEIARTTTRTRLADEQVKATSEQTTQARLQARTAEADAARAQAAAAQSQADSARSDAAAAVAAADARVAQMQARIKEIEAEQTERGLLVTLGDVNFQVGRFDLLPTAGPRMDKLAQFLNANPERKVLVEGFTDSTGGAQLNMTLSRNRAESVKSALVTRGVSADRISTVGHGTAHPVASNATAEGRAHNRRVEIVIADDKGHMSGRR